MLLALCHWIDHNVFLQAVNGSTPISIILEVSHYSSMMLIVGSMAFVDLRILGLAGRKQNLTDMAEDLLPWMWFGVIVNAISGAIMFCGEATGYYNSGVFRLKMLLFLLAVAFGLGVTQNAPKWGRESSVSVGVKAIALISMLLWIVLILVGNEVPAISNTG
jgi:hypothetical protein